MPTPAKLAKLHSVTSTWFVVTSIDDTRLVVPMEQLLLCTADAVPYLPRSRMRPMNSASKPNELV